MNALAKFSAYQSVSSRSFLNVDSSNSASGAKLEVMIPSPDQITGASKANLHIATNALLSLDPSFPSLEAEALAAISRLREREGENIGDWASDLAADLAKFSD